MATGTEDESAIKVFDSSRNRRSLSFSSSASRAVRRSSAKRIASASECNNRVVESSPETTLDVVEVVSVADDVDDKAGFNASLDAADCVQEALMEESSSPIVADGFDDVACSCDDIRVVTDGFDDIAGS